MPNRNEERPGQGRFAREIAQKPRMGVMQCTCSVSRAGAVTVRPPRCDQAPLECPFWAPKNGGAAGGKANGKPPPACAPFSVNLRGSTFCYETLRLPSVCRIPTDLSLRAVLLDSANIRMGRSIQ
eukprot:2063695-Rhodomonas_salina.1